MASPDATSRPPPSNPGPRATGVPSLTPTGRSKSFLRSLTRQEYPDDAFVGEEFGAYGHGRWRWIINAIDGTASLLAGEPEWSTLIAVEGSGRITMGMVSAPALGRRWCASPGSGSGTGPCPSRPAAPTHGLKLQAHTALITAWPAAAARP